MYGVASLIYNTHVSIADEMKVPSVEIFIETGLEVDDQPLSMMRSTSKREVDVDVCSSEEYTEDWANQDISDGM